MTLSRKTKEAIKTALRMFGTLVWIVATLTLITLFSQEHWAFMLFLSIFTVFCAYMMSVNKHQYFWQVCSFVCVIICMDAGAKNGLHDEV